jgi:hypothetical protein
MSRVPLLSRTDLERFPLPGVPLSTSCRQIFRVGMGKVQLCKINLEEEHCEFLDWFGPSGE